MASRVPSIKLHFIVEQEDPFDVWTGYRGRLNQLMLGLIASDYLEREVYCCGPEPFMQAVRDMLIALGFDMERYHQESFALAVETEEDAPVLDDFVPAETNSAELVFADSGVSAACNEIDTVLPAAKAAGLNIPNGCNFGVCGTCKILKTLGRGAHGPQRRDLRGRHPGGLHPRLLLPPDRPRGGGGLIRIPAEWFGPVAPARSCVNLRSRPLHRMAGFHTLSIRVPYRPSRC